MPVLCACSAQGKDKPLAGKVAGALESAESESEREPTASQRGAVEEAQDPLAKEPRSRSRLVEEMTAHGL